MLEKGESFPQTIEREIKEELGVKINVVQFVSQFFDEDASLKIRIFLYFCDIIEGKLTALECKNFSFFSHREIEKLDLAPADKKIFDYLKRF